MERFKSGKADRILGIYSRLLNGHLVIKAREAVYYGVNERTIQRDIDDIRNYLVNKADDTGYVDAVKYDRMEKGYRLEQTRGGKLSGSQTLALCKILLNSRAFTKEEMIEMLDKLVTYCDLKEDQKQIMDLISNEEYHYVEPRHKKVFIDTMWEIGQAVRECRYIEIEYKRIKDRAVVNRKVKPVGIMFSEHYFYMTAYIDDEEVKKDFDAAEDPYPTIYRIDRIASLKVLEERFHIPYSSRFEEGEFRKRIQFMCGGKLQKVKFQYLGKDIETVLDQLPTAEILSEENGIYTISAEVFGKGIDIWLRSQGENVILCKENKKQEVKK